MAEKNLYNQKVEAMKTPFEHIALAFSGGGFRAASFSLGVMTYLDSVRFNKLAPDGSREEKTLMEKVTYVSSASGGTIPNGLYALTIAKGGTYKDFYKKLFESMASPSMDSKSFYKKLFESMDGEAILARALDNLNSTSIWKERPTKTRNIINSFALCYDTDLLFDKATVSDLSDPVYKTHLEEVCFNSTEFFSGLPFRQAVKLQPWPEKHDPYFHYGNHIVCIDGDVVKKLKLADLLAASSCFPGGFEPIELPGDFCYDGLKPEKLKSHMRIMPQKNSKKEKEFIKNGDLGLMDGGITDNQGLESLMYADERRRELKNCRANNKEPETTTYQPFDLIMVNDVGSFYMSPYTVPKMGNRPMSLLTMNNIFILLLLTFLVGLGLFLRGFPNDDVVLTMVGSTLSIVSALILIPMFVFNRSMTSKKARSGLNLDHTFSQKIVLKLMTFMKKTPVGLLKQVLNTRFNSVMILTNDVFMKRIRQILYESFYQNPIWEYRRKGNHIYDLSFSNDMNRENREKGAPRPTYNVQLVAETACNMGTTLWFDDDSRTKTHNMACIIACGEFTTCYNLLGYVSKLRVPEVWNGLSDEYKQRVDEIDKKLKSDWDAFQHDPFFLYNKKGVEIWGPDFKTLNAKDIPIPDFIDPPKK